MSYKNFDQYIQELEQLIAELKDKKESLEKRKLELALAHQLSQNDAADQVTSLLRGYNPTGLNLSISDIDLKISDSDIDDALNKLFKLAV
jgi:ABC-type uncharacterized transport system ATPase subunit